MVPFAEQNLYAHARSLVGDRAPRAHEFTVQLRAMDADKASALLGVPALLLCAARCSARTPEDRRSSSARWRSVARSNRCRTRSRIAEMAVEKQAGTLPLPVAARRQLNDLPDDVWTKISIEFYRDAADAAFKAWRTKNRIDLDEQCAQISPPTVTFVNARMTSRIEA